MSKQNIHILLDSSTYLALKSKDVNISGTVNSLLKNFIDFEDINADESKILDDISEFKKEINRLNEKLNTAIVKLQIIRERDAKEKKDRERKRKMFVATMRHNNVLKEELMKK